MELFVATPLYELVEARLGSSPLKYIAERRELEQPVAYRRIALDLSEASHTDVTQEAVRRWWLAEVNTRRERDRTVNREIAELTAQ